MCYIGLPTLPILLHRLTFTLGILPGTVEKKLIDITLLHPDDDQEDHKWRDEILTIVAAVRST